MITAQIAGAMPALGGFVLAADNPIDHVKPHALFPDLPPDHFLSALSNHVLMLVLAAVLLLIFIPLAARKESLVPRGFRNFLEAIMQFLREEVARPSLGKYTDQFMPFLWTIFFLILTANVLGLVPIGPLLGLASQDSHLVHWGGTATGNIGITAGFAICAFFLFHISGIQKQGFGAYWKNFFLGHGPLWLAPLFIPLEALGALIKPFALAIRLFANMTGGHIVVAVLIGFAITGMKMGIEGSVGMFGVTLVSFAGAVAINLLELFVAFLQAYIFTFLTALFLGMAVHPEH